MHALFANLLPILPDEKMGRAVREGRFRHSLPGGKARATVFFRRRLDPPRAEALVKGKVDRISQGAPAGGWHFEASAARLMALAESDQVARVEDYLEQLPLSPDKGSPAAR